MQADQKLKKAVTIAVITNKKENSMNFLHYDGYDTEFKKLYNGELDPQVSTERKYTFGDILNIWTKPEYDNSREGVDPCYRMFIRDDYYLLNMIVVIGMDFRSYDRRTMMRYTYFKDKAFSTREAFCPTIEDCLDHDWYEYIPDKSEEYNYY